ncbi:Pantoate-beta-alanine ligase [Rosistilla oblonga]|uniref:pantoate--beta-alanine ligase n=1 Tax=Rosistilla oblonga TaxID=2527990 RepID=UPI00118A766D|nr:pantoate--beta-alanine ligase [Rosistilla oblonga]QDV15004.1 Pantoate-beta-alanine ligase [Rosistilla oblonga]
MKIVKLVSEAQRWTFDQRAVGNRVGLVPTMGALHAGHISLAQRSHTICDRTAATIFVNPTQFAPSEDLDKYPRTLDADLEKLEAAGVDLVFTPEPSEVYPAGFSTYVSPPAVGGTLEGASRPDHFRGVTTVVMKLFNIVPATHAFFGQKDYQQAAVISAMCRDLNVPIQLEICPIVREPDGLAMSSRNRYLSDDQRQRALGLSRALQAAQQQFHSGTTDGPQLKQTMLDALAEAKVDTIEYAVIADAITLAPLPTIDRPAVALIAARVGATRLIDNTLLTPGN